MKKTALLLIIAMLLGAAGCAGSSGAQEEPCPGFVSAAEAPSPSEASGSSKKGASETVYSDLTDPDAWEDFMKAVNSFSYESAKRLIKGDKNSCYSPVSLYFALAVCAAGATGETQREMLDALGVGNEQELCEGCRRLLKLLCKDSEKTKINIAGAIFIDDDVKGVKKDYADKVTNCFFTSVKTVDFKDAAEAKRIISDFIFEKTAGKLTYQGGVHPDTKFSIINTVYFLSRWISPFNKQATRKEIFHATDGDVECDMMNKYFESSSYYKGEGFVRFEMYFFDGERMAFILPDEGKLAEVLEMGAEAFTGGEKINTPVSLSLPKFEFRTVEDLIELLKDMGVKKAFDPLNAEFTEMFDYTEDPVFLFQAFQGTYVKVDEEGAEAAAYTAISGATGGTTAPEPVYIRFDRPFIYAIKGYPDTVLFTGVVVNPTVK